MGVGKKSDVRALQGADPLIAGHFRKPSIINHLRIRYVRSRLILELQHIQLEMESFKRGGGSYRKDTASRVELDLGRGNKKMPFDCRAA